MPRPGTIPHFEAVATLAALAVETTNARLGLPGVLRRVPEPRACWPRPPSPSTTCPAAGSSWASVRDGTSGRPRPTATTSPRRRNPAGHVGGGDPAHRSAGQRLPVRRRMTAPMTPILANPDAEPTRTSFEGRALPAGRCLQPAAAATTARCRCGWAGSARSGPCRSPPASPTGGTRPTSRPTTTVARTRILDEACEAIDRDPDGDRALGQPGLRHGLRSDSAGRPGIAAEHPGAVGCAWPTASGAEHCWAPRIRRRNRCVAYAEAGAAMVNVALRAPFEREALDAYHEVVMPAVRAEA